MTRTEVITQIIVPTLKRLADERFCGQAQFDIKDGYVIGGRSKQELIEFIVLREKAKRKPE